MEMADGFKIVLELSLRYSRALKDRRNIELPLLYLPLPLPVMPL
jgi:hypothetical protein